MLAALTDAQWGIVATSTVAVVGLVSQVVLDYQRRKHERLMARRAQVADQRWAGWDRLLRTIIALDAFARQVDLYLTSGAWAEDPTAELPEDPDMLVELQVLAVLLPIPDAVGRYTDAQARLAEVWIGLDDAEFAAMSPRSWRRHRRSQTFDEAQVEEMRAAIQDALDASEEIFAAAKRELAT